MDHDKFRELENKVMMMEHPTAEQTARIWAEHRVTKTSLARDVALIKEWFNKQPHLPAGDVDDTTIERLLVRCKNSVISAQKRLDHIYSLRSEMPEFYSDRDPLHPDIQRLHSVIGMCPLPRLTPDLQRVSLIFLRDPDVEKFDVELMTKVAFMGQDIILREPVTAGDVLIWDARGYTLAHAMSVSPVFIRKALLHITRTYPARMTGVHILFPPTFADRILSIIKSFLPDKLSSRIHTHGSLESLLEHIPQDVLPKEYGGQERSVTELVALWEAKLLSYREYFLHTSRVRSDESRRVGKTPASNLNTGVEGSFRKLELD